MEPLNYLSATQLAAAIQAGEISSWDVVQAHLAQIKRYNDQLNAIVILQEEAALAAAQEADEALARGEIRGSLHGVPVTIKEAFDVKGLKTTINFKYLKNYVATEDAPLVSRLKQAGAIVLGKTNVPTLLADWQTDGPIYGRANNPYDPRVTPGGSTGGGAASVAAGFSPLELGSDIAGSVRVPAHFCGLYSLKPTEKTLIQRGHIPPFPNAKGAVAHMTHSGPLARTLEDVKLAFELLSGPDYKDVQVAPIRWQVPSGKNLSDYHIAWTDTFGDVKAGRETCELLQTLATGISKREADIRKTNPNGFDFEKAWEVWGNIYGHVIGQDMSFPLRLLVGLQWRFGVKGPAGKGAAKGLGLSYVNYARMLRQRSHLIATLQTFFDEYDFWLCPVTMGPAFTHRKQGKDVQIDGNPTDYFTAGASFTIVFNLTGHPVLVVPLGRSETGLPIGMQVVGPYWSEPELFHFVAQLSDLVPEFKAPEGYRG